MSEKYFVVSETELQTLRYAGYMDIQSDLDETEAACRARPVVEIEPGVYNVRTDS